MPTPSLFEIAVSNFKSVRDSGDLALRKINLLVGPNSSGKTSIMQSFLALKQTLESRNLETPLTLRGKYVDLSSYTDVVFKHSQGLDLAITVGVTHDSAKLVGTLRFGYDQKSDRILGKGISFRRKTTRVEISGSNILIRLGKKKLEFQSSAAFEVRNILQFPRTVTRLRDTLDAVLYARQRVERFRNESRYRGRVPKSVLAEVEKYAKFSEGELVRSLGPNARGLASSQIKQTLNALQNISTFVTSLQNLLLERTYYIGPLREYPKSYYLSSGESPIDVGLRGEHMAEVIYYDNRAGGHLLKKVDEWMKKLNLGEELRLKPVKEVNVYVLSVHDPKLNTDVALPSIGFGVSQLLPIIVEGFFAKKGSVILMEQPEIHLHPRLQASLADLFIDMSKSGKQIIAETHSEHLIIRLQRRIAERTISSNDVCIYYFESTENGTVIRKVTLNRNGTIKEWPPGFFEEDINDSIGLLRAISAEKNGHHNRS